MFRVMENLSIAVYGTWNMRQALEKTVAVANDLNKKWNNSTYNTACDVQPLRRILCIASIGRDRLVAVIFITDAI